MKRYIKMNPQQIEAERKARERSNRLIKFWTIKVPVIAAMLFILWMFIEGGASTGVLAIFLAVALGVPWILFWNWIANSELK